MRDVLLYAHILIGALLILLPFIILSQLKAKNPIAKQLSFLTAGLSWILLIPAGKLYITFYPATKTVIKAGAWPWAHSIIMETKEHWGLLLPIIATTAAFLVYDGKNEESRKWWILLAIASLLIGIMGRIVKMGALAR
ncbi:TPA: hypothetical protein H1012_03420 [archaeon]|nr:hypothetical protein [Candidatus Naiadarchaeales archaeon SRR2090153.bin461]HIK02865.1 hypothetical protein [Candidatus Naiadarchaeales archaeon SRR2090159.bin1288]